MKNQTYSVKTGTNGLNFYIGNPELHEIDTYKITMICTAVKEKDHYLIYWILGDLRGEIARLNLTEEEELNEYLAEVADRFLKNYRGRDILPNNLKTY